MFLYTKQTKGIYHVYGIELRSGNFPGNLSLVGITDCNGGTADNVPGSPHKRPGINS